MSSHEYAYRGARALVRLQAEHMRTFLGTWRAAKDAGVSLPETDDPSYESLEALLRHVLRASRGYMVWICEVLELPDPDIRPTPEVATIEAEADEYLDHVLERWRHPLRDVTGDRFEGAEYASRWGAKYTVDSMLEHAVMHPIRHGFQLDDLMDAM